MKITIATVIDFIAANSKNENTTSKEEIQNYYHDVHGVTDLEFDADIDFNLTLKEMLKQQANH